MTIVLWLFASFPRSAWERTEWTPLRRGAP